MKKKKKERKEEESVGKKMESGSRFYSADDFRLDAKWLIDPKLLFVGPRIGEGAHAEVYEGK